MLGEYFVSNEMNRKTLYLNALIILVSCYLKISRARVGKPQTTYYFIQYSKRAIGFISSSSSVPSLVDCASLCVRASDCEQFNVGLKNPKSGQMQCELLKNDVATTYIDTAGWTSYVEQSTYETTLRFCVIMVCLEQSVKKRGV